MSRSDKVFFYSVGAYIALTTAAVFYLSNLETNSRADVKAALASAKQLANERDNYKKLYADCATSLKDFDSACVGLNCHDLFSSETAGVISTTYVGYTLSVTALANFCVHDERVNIGTNFPGARLMKFEASERKPKDSYGQFAHEYYLVTCSWLIPSIAWCTQEKR